MSLNLESSLAMLMAQSARRSAMASQAAQPSSGTSGTQQPADLNAAAARNDSAGQNFRAFNAASASTAAAPAMPGSGATATPAAASTARTNQDLINGYYKAGGGTWEGASRAARADGQNLNALVRNRQAAAGSTSAPTTPGTGSGATSGGASANPGTSGTSGTTGVNNAPAAGSVNERIAQATRNYMNTSTRSGPDGGNLACAWAVNNIMAKAGLPKIGANTNGVASVETALKNGKGTRVDASQAQPGDVVIWPAPKSHIGIYMGDGKVANNSSSKASFSNMSTLPAGSRIYRVNG